MKVIGKFGSNSKLSNTITLEPENENQAQEAADSKGKQVNSTAPTLSRLSLNLKALCEYCLRQSDSDSNVEFNAESSSLEKIVNQTYDLCFNLENGCKFFLHQVNLESEA